MRNRPTTIGPSILAAALILFPLAAQARFILTDAHFDHETLDESLGRRGALFDEPVPGPFDHQMELVADQGNGDLAIRMYDLSRDRSEMYWNLRDGMALEGGMVTARVEVRPDTANLTFALRTADQLSDIMAVDVIRVGSSAHFEWRDADSRGGTAFADVSPGTAYELKVEMDLTSARYSLWLDGTPIVTDEPHGAQGQALCYFVVGHLPDEDFEGVVEYDLVELDWRPDDTAVDLLSADFEQMTAGTEPQARGAYYGEPVSFVGSLVVESGPPLGDQALVLTDVSPVAADGVSFEFFGGVEPANQPVSISFAIHLSEVDAYSVLFREQGGFARRFLDMYFIDAGHVNFIDNADGGQIFATYPYSANTVYTVEVAFESLRNWYSVWINGERVVHRRGHGINDRNVGKFSFSNLHDPGLDGAIRIDQIEAHTLGQAVSVPDPAPVAAARLLSATPNPFNPTTELSFELHRAGHVTLDIFDSRGRRVRRLVEGHREPGLHRALWQGRDTAGRPLASGVYHARLEFEGNVDAQALTLIK